MFRHFSSSLLPRRVVLVPPSPHIRHSSHAALAELSLSKTSHSTSATFLHCVYGGVLLGLGGAAYVRVSGGSPALQKSNPGLHALIGAVVFPVGLSMITVTGAHLVTSNFFYWAFPYLTQVNGGTISNALRVWGASLAGNALGSLIVAGVVAETVFTTPPYIDWVCSVVEKKSHLTPLEAFTKGIGANFLVNVAVVMSASASTPGGKIVALWGPISVFVCVGLEHSVANMFLLPLGILKGADVTWGEALMNNLVPVIVGNAVGAFLLVYLHAPQASTQHLKVLLSAK